MTSRCSTYLHVFNQNVSPGLQSALLQIDRRKCTMLMSTDFQWCPVMQRWWFRGQPCWTNGRNSISCLLKALSLQNITHWILFKHLFWISPILTFPTKNWLGLWGWVLHAMPSPNGGLQMCLSVHVCLESQCRQCLARILIFCYFIPHWKAF